MATPATPRTDSADEAEHGILEQIHRSELFRNFRSAFEEATGLSLHLAFPDGHLIYSCFKNHRNPFCEMLDLNNPICEACAQTWRKIALFGELKTHTSTCFAGLSESSVPIKIGGKPIGFLFAGEVATSRLTEVNFGKVIAQLRESGVNFDESRLHRAYFSTPATSRKKHGSFLALLEVFAGHLSLVAYQLILQETDTEDPCIQRARKFIHANLGEPLELNQVAKCAGLSRCYFSKKFKESTRMGFTEYVAIARVEAAKKLLANPRIRVSEVAFQVGFQSLTHFNRVFKGVSGFSPTQFRQNGSEAATNPDAGHDSIDGSR